MKVVSALSAILLQCLVADAIMYLETQYSGTDCTAGTEYEHEWETAGVCHNISDTANPNTWIMSGCDGNNVKWTVYTDSACTTASTATLSVGSAPCQVTVTAGVYSISASQCELPPTGCSTQKPRMRTCASQPEQISTTYWSDATCTTPHKDGREAYQALGVCEWETASGSNGGASNGGGSGGGGSGGGGSSGAGSNGSVPMNGSSGNGSSSNSSTNQTGGRRLQTYESKMSAFNVATGAYTETKYSTKDCTGTATSTSTFYINSTCQMMYEGRYYKLGTHMTSAQAQAAVPAAKSSTSGGKPVWSTSVGSALVLLAVAKTLL